MVSLVKLLVSSQDSFGYITYVFENIETSDLYQKYIMCIRYPNWQCGQIDIDEIGYLEYTEVQAGVDKWFDGKNMIPYKYNAIQFIKFIAKKEEKRFNYVI
jgi:hypothetical protein